MQKKWTGERLETFIFNETTIEHLHRYALAKEFVKNKVVLDIACGEGYGTNLLAQEAISVIGVDIDQVTIDRAAKKYQKSNLIFQKGSAENISSDAHIFDVVVSFETLEHTIEHKKVLTEIKRVLKPEGLLLISTPEKKKYTDVPDYKNPFHKKELYKQEFTELLNSHFKYHLLWHQNVFAASLLWQTENNSLKLYEGNYHEIIERQNIEPLYLVAICSDEKISSPASSIFYNESVITAIQQETERIVKSTITHKVGRIILSPLKILRRLISEKKRNNH
jgi:ubiquinone/menaquinone biosynthesis C-methylase UbiE